MLWKSQTVPAAKVRRLGQRGDTTVKNLVMPATEVRHDNKDEAVGRVLGKFLVVLTKFQD